MRSPTLDEIIAQRDALLDQNVFEMDLDYKYPRDLDLHPKSDLSKFIIDAVNERCSLGKEAIQDHYQDWRTEDKTLSAYMAPDEIDNLRTEKDSRRPTTIVIPMEFAIRESFCTFMANAFSMGPQVHKYSGFGSKEAIISAALRERVIAKQSFWFKERMKLDAMFQDAFAYGRATACVKWSKHRAKQPVQEKVSELMAEALRAQGVDANDGDVLRYMEERTLWEGSELNVLDQYHCFYDPNSNAQEIQKSEFFAWQYRTSAMDILSKEIDPEEYLFNGKAVRILADKGLAESSWYAAEDARGRLGQAELPGLNKRQGVNTPVDVTYMYVRLIPKEWGLGNEEYPQIWCIGIAGDQVVIHLQRLDFDHGQLPIISMAPNADAHAFHPVSLARVLRDLQKFANWLAKSREDSANTILNGMIFVDPSRVDIEDMMDPGMGKLVRVKNSAYGEGDISRFVHQMQIQDVTAGHMTNIAELDQIARNAVGTTDIVMGQMGKMPERPTSAGIQAAQSGAFGRLGLMAMRIEEQCMRDLAFQMGMNTGQYMDIPFAVSLLGRYEQHLREHFGMGSDNQGVMVQPWDMNFPFSVDSHSNFTHSGSDIAAMSEFMKTMMAIEGVGAEIATDYRIADVFANFMRKAGWDDIDEYRNIKGDAPQMQIQTMPGEEAMRQEEQGNLVRAEQL